MSVKSFLKRVIGENDDLVLRDSGLREIKGPVFRSLTPKLGERRKDGLSEKARGALSGRSPESKG